MPDPLACPTCHSPATPQPRGKARCPACGLVWWVTPRMSEAAVARAQAAYFKRAVDGDLGEVILADPTMPTAPARPIPTAVDDKGKVIR